MICLVSKICSGPLLVTSQKRNRNSTHGDALDQAVSYSP